MGTANQVTFSFFQMWGALESGKSFHYRLSLLSPHFHLEKLHQPKERRWRFGAWLRLLSAAKIASAVYRKHHSTIAETVPISKVFKVLCQRNSYCGA